MDGVCVVSYSFFFPENITRGINKKAAIYYDRPIEATHACAHESHLQ